jgi:hypothetical protein
VLDHAQVTLLLDFFSYRGLSSSYHALVPAINSVQVPNFIEEALKDSG